MCNEVQSISVRYEAQYIMVFYIISFPFSLNSMFQDPDYEFGR